MRGYVTGGLILGGLIVASQFGAEAEPQGCGATVIHTHTNKVSKKKKMVPERSVSSSMSVMRRYSKPVNFSAITVWVSRFNTPFHLMVPRRNFPTGRSSSVSRPLLPYCSGCTNWYSPQDRRISTERSSASTRR